MRFDQLIYLNELSKHTSISAAAEALHLTQQSLSNAIKSLENELGVILLFRTNKGITLSPEGEKTLKTAQKIITEWNALVLDLQHKAAVCEKQLNLLVTPNLMHTTLSKHINHFAKLYPDIPMFIENETIDKILTNYDSYLDYDLIFISLIFKKDKPLHMLPAHVSFHELERTNSYLAVNKNSPFAKLSSISLEQIQKIAVRKYLPEEQCVSPEQKKIFNTLYHKFYGLKNDFHTSDSISYCMQGVLDNLFALWISGSSEYNFFLHPDINLIPIETDVYSSVGFLLPKNISLNKTASKFINMMIKD